LFSTVNVAVCIGAREKRSLGNNVVVPYFYQLFSPPQVTPGTYLSTKRITIYAFYDSLHFRILSCFSSLQGVGDGGALKSKEFQLQKVAIGDRDFPTISVRLIHTLSHF